MVYFSIILILSGVAACYQSIRKRLIVSLLLLIAALGLVAAGLYLVADSMSGDGINEAVLYHLNTDLTGAGFLDFWPQILFAALFIFGIFVLVIYAYRLMLGRRGRFGGAISLVAALALFGLSYYFNPFFNTLPLLYQEVLTNHLGKISQAGVVGVDVTGTPQPEQFMHVTAIDLPQKKKNIVYLYLEGFERTYFDAERFPGLVPNLKKLEQQAVSFTNVQNLIGTGWTIAGLVASQCGIPLFMNTISTGNSMEGVDQFLSGASCIGDLLQQHQYALHYLGGARLSFAGKGAFFQTHGFERVEGRNELVNVLDDSDYINKWGLFDDSLFALAKQRFDKLAGTGQPFGLFLLSLDTHHPRGLPSESCDELPYQDGKNKILNAVHCSDHLAADFINHILRSDVAADTILVVASDHFAHQNTASSILEAGPRSNLLLIFDQDLVPQQVNRAASTLDVAPTILNLVGATIPGMGFGRDLLAPAATLTEQTEAHEILTASRNYIKSLWIPPRIDAGIKVDDESANLIMAERKIRLPVLFLLDSDLKITDVGFGLRSKRALARTVYKLHYDQRFLWADKCIKNGFLAEELVNSFSGYCAVMGAPGSEQRIVIPLQPNLEIKFPELQQLFASPAVSTVSKENYRKSFLGIYLTRLLN